MPAVVFSRFEAECLALYRPPMRRQSTWYKVRKVLREFGELPCVRRTSDLTPLAITAWLDAHDDRAPMTNRSYLSSFRACCTYGRKMGYLKVSPWEIRKDWVHFDLDDDEKPPPRHLSIDELERLMSQVDGEALTGGWLACRLQALVYVYIHTGLRKCEALGLKVEDVNLPRGLLRVKTRRKRRLKTRNSGRIVGIPDDLADVLGRWVPQTGSEWLFPGVRKTKPWMTGSPGSKPLCAIKAVAKRAGVEHVTIQALRRSIATHAKRLNIERAEVKDLLGHSSVRTQEEWYLEADADDARDLARRIRFRSTTPSASPRPSAN